MAYTPTFSVVLPLYNKEESIGKTIQSILAQTLGDFELLVVNDGSKDKSREVVAAIADPRIRIVDKPNGGVSSARNTGIREAKAGYIAFIDGDDLWAPDFLATIQQLITNYPTASVFATGFAGMTRSGEIGKKNIVAGGGIIGNYFKLVLNNAVIHSSAVCVKKEAFSSILPFNEKITHGEDLDVWARLAQHFQVAMSPEVKSYYIQDAENRASVRLPAPDKSLVYYLNTDNVQEHYQKKYYQQLIVRRVMKYLQHKKVKWALVIARKYNHFLGIGDYIHFTLSFMKKG
ncbi:MAG: glycosyltransferase family 2 protein [Chitinophaga sp.]|uniref:glycosyltransferase family 2 protein n=1 Tax=Chitinophaga sp. TaxID=1869181 RepID=UPI001B1AFF73|nr:glycosyltransferase family 2 protein [Chitinophaga sp.]MBO9732309.1 glycosyltransferase family 2 protein [Chitinophaga sp.]